MDDQNSNQNDKILELTAQITSAYLGNNVVSVDDIPAVVNQVYAALGNIGDAIPTIAERPQPAVPINRSITPDFLICLEDGKKLKMLKRHLKTAYDMTPDQYRERWGLPADYPMVAPNYAAKRSKLAKDIGLGTRN